MTVSYSTRSNFANAVPLTAHLFAGTAINGHSRTFMNTSGAAMKTNWNWTPRAKMIGTFLQAVAVVGIGWILFVGTWYALGGN